MGACSRYPACEGRERGAVDHYHLAIVCENAGSSASVARVATRHALELSRFFRISLFSDTLPIQREANISYVFVNSPRFDFLRRYCHVPNQAAFALWTRRLMARVHLKDPIHGIICHSHTVAALAAEPFGRPKGIPYGLVTHGDIFDVPPGSYDSRLTWFYKAVHPPAYRNAALIVALSPHMAKCAMRSGANPENVRVVPNGIDISDMRIASTASGMDFQVDRKTLSLLFVGRLAKEKGVEVLLQAARLLADRGVAFHLRIVGEGPEGDHSKRVCAQLGLEKHVTFPGALSRSEMGRVYEDADLVCVPSLSDPLPTVVLEAMAMRRAVIGSDVGGIPFMISNRETGMLVEPGSAAALAHEIAELASNRGLLQKMGERAAFVLQSKFSWTRIGGELAMLIKEKMDPEGRAGACQSPLLDHRQPKEAR